MQVNNSGSTYLWQLYKKGLDYQNKIGLRRDIPTFVNFYEGKQWPDATENTKNLPRPVINIIKMICRNKKSSILSTPVRVLFKCYSDNVDTEKFNAFAQNLFKQMRQDEIDKRAIDDAVKKGSYFYHYYWDMTADGDGELRCELIDPLNIFFANPTVQDEQKQKWIIISTRAEAQAIRDSADDGVNTDLVEADEDGYCTVLTRYFRRDGEVYCERATEKCQINAPFSITPDADAAMRELHGDEDFQKDSTVNGQNTHTWRHKTEKATLYPIVCGCYERRENSIYGLSEVEGLIPNQKAINFNIAMSLLNAQETAWGKYITLPNALKGQKISNVPGQVLVDYSGTGDGIKKMKEQNSNAFPMDTVQTIISLTRSVCGSSEVMTGEMLGSNMSGAAIAQLQAQAELPIGELRNEFWHVKQRQGMVLAQFMKLFYYESNFIKTEYGENGEPLYMCDSFSSEDFDLAAFDVTVEATGGARASASGDISMLDECLRAGKISLESYIRAYPDSAVSNKDELLKQLEREKKEGEEYLKSENSRLEKELAEARAKLSEQSDAYDKALSLIEENGRLKAKIIKKYVRESVK